VIDASVTRAFAEVPIVVSGAPAKPLQRRACITLSEPSTSRSSSLVPAVAPQRPKSEPGVALSVDGASKRASHWDPLASPLDVLGVSVADPVAEPPEDEEEEEEVPTADDEHAAVASIRHERKTRRTGRGVTPE